VVGKSISIFGLWERHQARGGYSKRQTKKERNMKRQLGTSALILGITLAMVSGSFAQVGRDGAQGGGAAMDNSTGGSMSQKGMKGTGGAMHNGTMQNGTSGKMQSDKMQSGGAGK
jgi:hypothetical protein